MAQLLHWLTAFCVAFVSHDIVFAQEGYRLCTGMNSPEIITEPQMLKIKAPPLYTYQACDITFTAPEGQYVKLMFFDIDIGNIQEEYGRRNSCYPHNWISVSDGLSKSELIGHRLCGNTCQLPPEQRVRRSSGNTMQLRFTNNFGSFQVEFHIVSTPGEKVCPDSVVELSGSGTIVFPGADNNKVHSSLCQWRITAAPTKKVKLIMRSNELGQGLDTTGHDCSFISVSVYDGPDESSGTLMQQLCNATMGSEPSELVSTDGVMFLKFANTPPLPYSYFATGFVADYLEI